MKQNVIYFSVIMILFLLANPFGQTKPADTKQAAIDKLHPPLVEAPAPMGIKLLQGYVHRSATDFEGNKVGQIYKEGGVKIRYEIGMSQGHAVNLDQKNNYQWYKEQIVHGGKVKLALDKKNMLIITLPLDAKSSWHAANFYGEIKKPEHIVDMILMVFTFEL